MTVVIGTAGHIDHGKTSLLRALTGIDADRLPEERRRGMTIDVGYAWLDLEDGTSIDFVDVPGHDALIGNMLVGAGEIDAAMLVVAADDGIRAQTIEHLELLDALELRVGLAVVTKTDIAGPARAAEVSTSVAELLASSPLAGARVLEASSANGAGIEAVRAEIVRVRDLVAARRSLGPPERTRLATDRAFTVRGRGVVVTGTLRGGPVRVGDAVRVLPVGRDARIRGLQVHHGAVEFADGGGRVALNLAGVEAEALPRGSVLVPASDPVPVPGQELRATDRLLVALGRPLAARTGRGAHAGPPATWPPRDGDVLRLHVGTAAVDARVTRRAREAIDLPDGRVSGLLRLAEPIATFAGDRGILRRPSPGAVVAGVEVLDAMPAVGTSRRRATPERVAGLAIAVREADPASIADATQSLHGVVRLGSGMRLAPDVADLLETAATRRVAEHHAANPASTGLRDSELRAVLRSTLRRSVTVPRDHGAGIDAAIEKLLAGLVERRRLARDGDRYRDPGRAAGPTSDLIAAMDRLVAAIDVPAPPDLADAARSAGCPPEGIRELEAAGRIVRVEADLAWSRAAFERLVETALALARRGPLTPAALRDATGTTRRVVMPLLEELNRRGLLVRTPAGHLPGPRAPRAADAT